MSTLPADNPLRANPVLWLVFVILGGTVIAGLTTLAIALRKADRPLPASYHWEGEHLDRDFALARVAATHGIEVSFAANSPPGQCSATVRNAPGSPQGLNLLFANAADPGLDRALHLSRVEADVYRGVCTPLPEGRWRVSLEDDAGTWSIRTQLAGRIDTLELRARNPEGNP